MFGSRVEEALRAAGHEVTRERAGADAVVVDLTADGIDLAELAAENKPTVGFYPHVDVDTRRRALEAGVAGAGPRPKSGPETAPVGWGALAPWGCGSSPGR